MLRSNVGQGLPVSTIIIAILGLIVLLIVGGLVANRVGLFSSGSRAASEQKCVEGDNSPNVKMPLGTPCEEVIYGRFVDLGPDEICCRKSTVASESAQ
ncbi:hypothetical protein D6825_03220 [Candidatus Woesearchaeota archaeon]|nr:MAG: hypothetical protein D6825_03220 [Candidatus Woesearchaeota archaeon]